MMGARGGRQTKVLVVDEDAASLTMLAGVVQACGYAAESAADGAQAWSRMERGGVQLVITDWEMPGMNGLDLCRRVRAAPGFGYVYLILVTVHHRAADIVEGLSAGADDFIVKPYNPAELAARLRNGERVVSLESRDLTILALAKLVESRDPETGFHLERVQGFCRVLAEHLLRDPRIAATVPVGFAGLLSLTCVLHDIGKIGIPDAILLKPGRLDDEEFGMMKQHCTIGAETLGAALRQHPHAGFLEMARDIAMHHHERYDGKGYPARLAGDAIPLSARIVALADVYDALTSQRAYKGAQMHVVARGIIMGERGRHFDPVVCDAFLACEREFERIRAEHSDAPKSGGGPARRRARP